jgi:hypothetical protein
VSTRSYTERALIHAKTNGLITDADRQLLKGEFIKVNASWNFLEITGAVRKRACMVFPVEPVRSPDAIHLATALELLLVYPDVSILTCNRRIINNMVPPGLKGVLLLYSL